MEAMWTTMLCGLVMQQCAMHNTPIQKTTIELGVYITEKMVLMLGKGPENVERLTKS